MDIIASIITLLAAYFIGGILNLYFNWSDAPTVVAISTMGFFLLQKINQKDPPAS